MVSSEPLADPKGCYKRGGGLNVPVELHIILSRQKGEAIMKEIHELTSIEGLICSCQALNS